jgi:hypothetical protein
MLALDTTATGSGHFAAGSTTDAYGDEPRTVADAITLLQNFADILDSPTGRTYDVVINTSPADRTAWGHTYDLKERLIILRGELFPTLNRAANKAGAVLVTYTPSTDLRQRVENRNRLMGENVSPSTLGVAQDVKVAVDAMLAKLRAQPAQTLPPSPAPASRGLSSGVKIALAVGAGVVVLGGGYLVLRRR